MENPSNQTLGANSFQPVCRTCKSILGPVCNSEIIAQKAIDEHLKTNQGHKCDILTKVRMGTGLRVSGSYQAVCFTCNTTIGGIHTDKQSADDDIKRHTDANIGHKCDILVNV